MATIDYAPAIAAIDQAKNILVLPSSPPDGDSIGSALALYLALQKKGKKVTVVAADPVPDAYKFLPDSQTVESDYNFGHDFIVTLDVANTGFKDLQYEVKDHKVNIIITPEHGQIEPGNLMINQDASKFDLIITVDTAEVKQLGKVYEANQDLFEKLTVINIDHHPSNTKFGNLNLVSPDKAATTLMLTEMFQAYDSSVIDSDVATLLLAGLITDTGSFQNSNTSPEAFDTAAMLIGLGARQQEIIRHVYKTKELHTLRLWGRVLSNIQTDYDHRLVWSTVTQTDFAETNSKESDIGDIIDELLSNAPEAEVVVLFKELPENVTHLSIRTTTDEVNASKIAQNFGGGGHRRAAGANVSKPFNEVVEEVLAHIREVQKTRQSGGSQEAVVEQPVAPVAPAPVEQPPVAAEPIVSAPEAPQPAPAVEAPASSAPESMGLAPDLTESVIDPEQPKAALPPLPKEEVPAINQQAATETKEEAYSLPVEPAPASPAPQAPPAPAPTPVAEVAPAPQPQIQPTPATPPAPTNMVAQAAPVAPKPEEVVPAPHEDPVIDPYAVAMQQIQAQQTPAPATPAPAAEDLDTYIQPDAGFNVDVTQKQATAQVPPAQQPETGADQNSTNTNDPGTDADQFSNYLKKF